MALRLSRTQFQQLAKPKRGRRARPPVGHAVEAANLPQIGHPCAQPITLTLSWCPSINHYWRYVGSRPLISKEGRQYKRQTYEEIGAQWPAEILRPFSGRLMVTIFLHGPTHGRYDVDNRVKPLLDALTHAHVWLDDAQVDILHVFRGAPYPKQGRLFVFIAPAPGSVSGPGADSALALPRGQGSEETTS